MVRESSGLECYCGLQRGRLNEEDFLSEEDPVSAVNTETDGLDRLKRVRFCTLPTPLVEAPGLSAALSGPKIFFKRDDLTGLALGGNKARALEFVMGEAKASGQDVVIAVGPQHSNQLCAIAAAARKCGMDVVLLLLRGDDRLQGNPLLFRLLEAEVRSTGVGMSDIAAAYGQMKQLAERLRNEGRRPLELKYGPLPLVGVAGYVLLMREILEQLGTQAPEGALPKTHHVFVGSGSGLTQAGLILANALAGSACKIYGIMLDPRFGREEHEQNVWTAVEAAAALLGAEVEVAPSEVVCIEGYADDGAEVRTKAADALKLVAKWEGIFLDPVYTGRVMAALIDHICAGRTSPEDEIVFYHSGGIPGIFSHGHKLLSQVKPEISND